MLRIATPKRKTIRMTKLDLDAELRLMKALKREMDKDGERPTAERLRAEGLSEPFIKRFLSLWGARSA
jgi:hypothetical protein